MTGKADDLVAFSHKILWLYTCPFFVLFLVSKIFHSFPLCPLRPLREIFLCRLLMLIADSFTSTLAH